jgi:hypothetical protein
MNVFRRVGVVSFAATVHIFLGLSGTEPAMQWKYLILLVALPIVGLGCSLVGCSSGGTGSNSESRAAQGVLRVLGTEYADFVLRHGGRPPKAKEELTAFISAHKSRITGLEDVEQLFQSPRDKQPLVIFYGESMPPTDESGFASIACEMSGVGGKVFVANTRGGVQELSSDQLPHHLDNLN